MLLLADEYLQFAASYQALSLEGVRFVPIAGYQLALQIAWAADNANTALPAFLDTARHAAAQPIRPQLAPGHLPRPSPDGRSAGS